MDTLEREIEGKAITREDLPADGDIHFSLKIKGGRAFLDLALFVEVRPQI